MKKIFKDELAEWTSLLGNPVLFLILMPFLFIYRLTGSGYYAIKWELFSLVFFMIGAFLLFRGRLSGKYSDLDLSKKEERAVYYHALCLLSGIYLAATIFFKGIFYPMSIVAMGTGIGTLLFAWINQYVKASIHVGVVCAFVLSIGILYGNAAFLLLSPIIPLIAWARLYLKRHTLNEIISGGILGSVITLGTYSLGRYIFLIAK